MIDKKILDFLTDDNQFLIIDGPAGTGKTTLIRNLILEAEKLGLTYEAIAYTGKAASNLRNKCNGVGKTIHSFLYTFQPQLNKDDETFSNGWSLNEKELDILFLDECSMVSNRVEGFKVNQEKTYLLVELLTAVKLKKIKKILLVGDSYQLPPILDEAKKDLKKSEEPLYPDSLNEYLIESKYNLRGSKASLDENKRYKENLEAYNLSIQVRNEIITKQSFEGSPKKWLKQNASKDNFLSSEEEVINWVIEKGKDSNFTNVRILTYSNKKSDEWNRKIRIKLGKIDKDTGEVEAITINEPLMNLVNKEYSKFYNGDTFIVTEIIGKDKKLRGDLQCNTHPSCKDKPNRPTTLNIIKAKIQVINEDSNEEKIVQIVNRAVVANDTSSIGAYNHRLWCDFATRNSNLYLNRNKSEKHLESWNKARSNDEQYGSGIASYAYSSTVHKTQGDSFPYVVIDLEDEDRNLKWLYTSLTRSTKEIMFFRKKIKLFSKLNN